jgi:hypothetical protein
MNAAIRMIIHRKINAPLKHTFAVATYNSASVVTWRTGFTSDFHTVDESLSQCVSLCVSKHCSREEEDGPVVLSEIFSQLESAVATASAVTNGNSAVGHASSAEQDYITRYIFFYCRSSQVPVYTSTRPYFPLCNSGRAPFLDIVFLHHKLVAYRDCAASCQETLNVLSLLQRGGEFANFFCFLSLSSNIILLCAILEQTPTMKPIRRLQWRKTTTYLKHMPAICA